MADEIKSELDRLTGQLYYLPGIIGKLGVSVANAQKTLNEDYLLNVQKIMGMASDLLKGTEDTDKKLGVMKELLKEMAPSRYQFTETSLEFSADLSERSSTDLQGAIGGGFAGVTITAGYAKAFAYDYRAAARVKTVLHAMPPNEATFGTLVERAKELGIEAGDLPSRTQLETNMFDGLEKIKKALEATKIGDAPEET